MKKLITTPLILSALSLSSAFAADHAREGAIVKDPSGKFFKYVKSNPELIIDHKVKDHFEVYGPVGTKAYLKSIGAKIENLEEEETHSSNQKLVASYPSPEEINEQVYDIVTKYSSIMTVETIGQTSDGRDLLVVKISDNPTVDELEPEVKYIANMHGNEIVGREMMVAFLEDLGARYTKGEANIVSLINNTEVFIMPSMNPDGASNKRRANADWTDLNRNFPDFSTSDNTDTANGRAPETQAVMSWQSEHNFSLSANFHGGTQVVNYPWDTSRESFPFLNLVVDLSAEYANEVPGFYDSDEFRGGITNGYTWYEVDGGMQDWSYYYHNDLQLTIEVSHNKWPSYATIDGYYQDNKKSLVQFLTRVHQGLGVKFTGSQDAKSVTVFQTTNGQKKNLGTFGVAHQEFYKILPEGSYAYEVTFANGSTQTVTGTVSYTQGQYTPNYIKL